MRNLFECAQSRSANNVILRTRTAELDKGTIEQLCLYERDEDIANDSLRMNAYDGVEDEDEGDDSEINLHGASAKVVNGFRSIRTS